MRSNDTKVEQVEGTKVGEEGAQTKLVKSKSSTSMFKFKQNSESEKDIGGGITGYLMHKSNYRPVSSHHFRDLEKKKWLGGSFRVF